MKEPVEPCTSMNDLDPTELDREISIEEVEAAIHLNHNHKSPGIDGIKLEEVEAAIHLNHNHKSSGIDGVKLEEVEAAIHLNHNHKSPGIDGIKPAYIKNEVCIKFIHTLCNYCFKYGKVPTAWFKAIIKPIPKSSNTATSPSEYRGISLQFFVAKTYCRILNSRLRDYLEDNEVLCDEQNGFRPYRSCQDHIFTLTSVIENRILWVKTHLHAL